MAMVASLLSVVVPSPASAADPNIAVGKTATSDSGSSTVAAGNDDSIYTAWRADDGNNGHYFQVDLGGSFNLSGSEVVFEAAYLEKYKVETSTDATHWSAAVDKTNNTSTSQTQTDPFTASGQRYVRITLTTLPPGTVASIYEFRVFGVAAGASAPGAFSQASPAAGATGVSTTPTLSWGAASGAATYGVVVSTSSSFSSPVVNVSGLTSTSYAVPTALANSTQYYWKVTATNATGSTVASNAGLSFTTAAGASAPGAFSQASPAAGATGVSTTPTLSWGAASGAATYGVVVSTSSSFSSPVVNASGLTSTSYAVPTALANSTQYYWKVTATNATGSTVASNAGLSFTTAAGASAPGAFSQASPAAGATGVSTTPTLSWGAASGAATYGVVVSTSSSFSSPVVNASGLTSTSYAVPTALANSTQYYWKVTATNATGSTVASNAGLSFTTAAACTPPCSGVTSGAYVVNDSTSTISKVENGTTVDQFLANLNIPSGATVRVYQDNGFTQRIGAQTVQTSNLAIVSGSVNKTYTISVIVTSLTPGITDTFDDVAGNSGLGGWGLPYGGNLVTVSGANKALQIVNSGPNALEMSRNFAPISGKVLIKERMLFTDNQTTKSAPRIYNNSDLIGELSLQSGKLYINTGSGYALVAGGSAIAANAWYDISVQVDLSVGSYTAWVGTSTASASYNLLTAATAVSGVAYLLPQADSNGVQIDSLSVSKVLETPVAAPPSSIARATIPNDYFVVTDSGNSAGGITVYTGTTVNDLLARLTAINGGTLAVTGKSGTAVLQTGDVLVVTSADASTTRSYSVTVTVNQNANVYSVYPAVTVDNAARTVTGVDSDTSVDVFRGIIEPAKNGSYVIKDQSGAVKTSGVILATDTLLVSAESTSVTPRVFAIALVPDNIVAKYYVDPANGNDANSGTLASPFQTLDHARTVVNGVKNSTNGDIAIYLRGGTYALTAPFVLGTGDSGVNGHTIFYKAYGGEQAVIDGGQAITGWTVDKTVGGNTIYKANARSLNFGQLYVNDRPATVARYPNAGTENAVTGWDLTTGSPQVNTSEVPAFTNDASNPVRIKLQARWIDISLPIASMTSSGGTTTVTATDPARQPAMNMAPGVQSAGNPYHFENAYEFLDVPGEWYLNKTTNTVYYVAAPGQDMSTTKVVAPKLEELVKFVGTVGNPVHDITFSGITFQDTTWLAPLTDGFFWGSWSSFPSYTDSSGNKQPGWVTALAHRPLSAVLIQDGQRITLTKSTVRETGGDGIFVRESQGNSVVGNAIYDTGYHGIELGMFENYDSDKYAGVDYEHGTPTDTRYIESNDVVSNNYISRVGQTYLDGIGIKVGWASSTDIEHNTIYNVPYSGMMLGNGKPTNKSPLGNLTVAYNDVSRNNTLLADGAAIYTYALHSPKTLIEYNYLHDGFYSKYEDSSNVLGLYFDDGASGFNVVGNLVSNEVTGEINGSEAEHIALGDTFTGNQPTDPAVINSIIANAGQQLPYQYLRLAPTATRFPGKIRVQQGDTNALQVKFGFAPGWTIYYTTDGTTPGTSSQVANGYITIPSAAATTYRVVAINNTTGARSEEISGTYTVETVLYSYDLAGTGPLSPLIDGHTRSTFQQASTGWRWSGFTPKPADYDPTAPPAGLEWQDIDTTLYLDPGTGSHIQFTGRPTGSGNTAGAYAYSLVSSTGSSTTANGSLDNLQNTSVEIGSDGGPWPYLPGTVAKAGSPYPEKLRLLMRDNAGTWYLSTSDTAATALKAGNFAFDRMSTLHWQRLNNASQAILNSAPNPDATQGAISVDAGLVTPDLSHITGTGLYIDSVANETSFLRFRGMTFLQ